MLIILLLVSLFRGDGKRPSIIGVKKCTPADNAILSMLIVLAFFEFVIGVWWIISE
jgi:hypothetical protein